MVFMKKGATPSKTPQLKKGKKAVQVEQESDDEMDFNDMDDSDDDIDSDEAPQLQKTPVNKGAKGRQSMSEKKVSFAIPGKNSPAVKTPKKDNSILVKKQPTPANKGKTAMQEFKGMKGKNQTKKEMEEDDDDDDEDDDDDDEDEDDVENDFDVEEGDEDGEDDLGLDEGDDDDDEDDDDEDDDEDDEDDEDQANIQKKLAMLKQNVQQNKQKTPVKGNDKAKNAESPKEKTPKKELEQKSSPKKNPPQQVVEELERRRDRDARMLFIGGLPKDIKTEELKALSGDIIDVTLPLHSRKHHAKVLFGFLCFSSEAKAESNFKSLQGKKLRGQPVTVDFVGLKSKNKKVAEDTGSIFNMKKLFVSGIPLETTIDKIAKHFPLAYQIAFNQSPLFRSATISFDTEESAKHAYESNKEIEISGQKLIVLYSKQMSVSQTKKKKHNRKVAGKNSFGGGMNKNSSFGGGMNKNSSFGGKNNNSPFGGKNKNNSFAGNPNPAKKMKFMKKSAGGDEE